MNQNNTEKPTIGIVLSTVPGYSETFFRNKIKGLQERGFQVVLFVDYSKSGDLTDSCKVVVANNFNLGILASIWSSFLALLKLFFLHPKRSFKLYQLNKIDSISFKDNIRNLILNQFFLAHNVDWLHFGFGMLAVNRENVATVIGAKMAVSFRGFDLYLSPLKHPGCYDILFEKTIDYHVLSQGMKQILLNCHHIPEHRIHVITPAIDTSFFKAETKQVEKETINIVSVARLHWIKGLDYTLEALSIIKQRGVNFKYSIIGEGEQYEQLKYLIHQLKLSDCVQFVGKLTPKEVKSYYQKSDIYLQYSFKEGFCNAVLEAQAMGLLCIVSDVEALNENVLDSVTGWTVPQRNPIALAGKIIEVINLSQNEKQHISENAIKRVKSQFNLSMQNAAFYDFYIQKTLK